MLFFGKNNRKKEFEKKMQIRKAIQNMQRQLQVLEEQKENFIQKAREAKQFGLEAQYNLALEAYKMTITQQKRTKEMLLNFEITSQMKDITLMTKDFLAGMSVLSKEMIKLADEKQFKEVEKQFTFAMKKAESQAEQMDAFMEKSQTTLQEINQVEKLEDSHLQTLIDEKYAQIDFSDATIDAELATVRKALEEQFNTDKLVEK